LREILTYPPLRELDWQNITMLTHHRCVRRHYQQAAFCAVAIMVMLLSSSVHAAQWSVAPSLTVSETYIDNVRLSSNSDKQSDLVTQINPSVALTGNGKNLTLSLRYNLQNLVYLDEPSRNNSYHQLRSSLNATLLPQRLFIDASTSLSQQVLSPDDKVSIGNLGVVSNRSDVLSTRVSPYLRSRLGENLQTEIRYSYDNVSYSDSSALNSSSGGLSVNLRPNRALGSWSWQLNWQQREIYYDDRADERRESASLRVSYQVSARIGFNGVAGIENNKYSSQRASPRGEYWNLGANWRPSSRTNLSATAGERFFGRTWSLNFAHQARRHNWGLSYAESISSRRALQSEIRELLLIDPDGNPVIDPDTLEPRLFSVAFPVSFNQVFIRKTATANWGMRTKKTTSGISVFTEQRSFEGNGVVDEIFGSTLRWSWQVSRKNQFSTSMTWRKTLREDNDDIFRVASASLSQRINKSASASISLRRLQRVGDSINNTYTSNTITASLRISW